MLLHPATARGICKKPKRKGGLRFETKRRSLCMRDKCQSQTPEREIEHIAYFSEQEGATLRLRLYVHKTEAVIDKSFPAELETPEELLQ